MFDLVDAIRHQSFTVHDLFTVYTPRQNQTKTAESLWVYRGLSEAASLSTKSTM